MAVTASTPANLVIGAGDVYADGDVVGASVDDNTYRIDQTFFVPELNGVPGELRGTHYKVKETAIIETSIPEIDAVIMALAWPGSQSAVSGSDTTIDTTGIRRIPLADYHDWELRLPGLDGKQFSFFADGAINQGTIEANAADQGVFAPRLELHSTWDAADLAVSPHRIVVTAA